MNLPSQTEAFELLYAIASADGREETLFGGSIRDARAAFGKMRIGSAYPAVYLEFPLLGPPCFDMLTVYGSVGRDDRFAPGGGFGYEKMFRWFSGLPEQSGCSCGIELDTGSGDTERAGAYLQFRARTRYAEAFLDSLGESGRTKGFYETVRRLPEGWPPAYIGLFSGREGTPLRVGGYMEQEQKEAAARDPALLGEQFRRIGFEAYDPDMLKFCAELMAMAPGVDFQFDILPDGSLGDVFGLSLSFNEVAPSRSAACMESGFGARLMRRLQDEGLADGRWEKIAGAAFAKGLPAETEDGNRVLFAAMVRLNYAKVKFRCGKPAPAKFYLMTKAAALPAGGQPAGAAREPEPDPDRTPD